MAVHRETGKIQERGLWYNKPRDTEHRDVDGWALARWEVRTRLQLEYELMSNQNTKTGGTGPFHSVGLLRNERRARLGRCTLPRILQQALSRLPAFRAALHST